jgi:hypothetical protein
MSNFQVAKYLLTHGLSDKFDGVVFLDDKDRKMILMKHGMNVVRLNQAGVPPERRFSFYDQVHTTGMDIHQCIDARAALTLGKDMTFRDYAQGAFRMRGIGQGQTIELFIIPEVLRLIDDRQKRVQRQIGVAAPAHVPAQAVNGFGSDLLSLASAASSPIGFQSATQGNQLLINVAAWLTVNGMKSENVQFRMLCHQSVDNVMRKRAYGKLTGSYRELTQMAFASRVKEFAALAASSVGGQSNGDIDTDVDGFFEGRKLFADDMTAIRSVVQAGVGGTSTKAPAPVGIEKIQKCLDMLTERIDYTVQNDIPIDVPLSETIRNSIIKNSDLIENDYDKAVVDKIVMVLTNSEQISKRASGRVIEVESEEEEEESADLQKEQVGEEEVLQEQEEEEEEVSVRLLRAFSSRMCWLLI